VIAKRNDASANINGRIVTNLNEGAAKISMKNSNSSWQIIRQEGSPSGKK